ncbi:MAG: energy-coupling factor transporter transmembrane component T [Sutterella sp.]|nr:energy-coupling factor transporter transmembrane component T [Sutterella sp.]
MRTLPVRVRLLCLLLLTTVSVTAHSLPSAAAGAAAAFAGAVLIGGLKGRLRQWLSVNVFILFIWILTPMTTPGEAVVGTGWYALTREGLTLSLMATLKCNAAFFWYVLWTDGLTLSAFARGLSEIGFPQKLVTLLLLTARQIGVFSLTARQLGEAARLRGFVMRADLRTYRTAASFAAILFLRAREKSRVMEEALRLRAFTGVWPSAGAPEPITAPAAAASVLAVLLSALLILLNFPELFS